MPKKKMIDDLVEGDKTDVALQWLGNFSPESTLQSYLGMIGPGAGMAAGAGPVGWAGAAVMPIAGTMGRKAATKRSTEKAQDIRDFIANVDTLPEPMPPPPELLQLPPPQRLLTYQPPTLPPAAPQLMLPPPATRGGDALRRFRRPGQ